MFSNNAHLLRIGGSGSDTSLLLYVRRQKGSKLKQDIPVV